MMDIFFWDTVWDIVCIGWIRKMHTHVFHPDGVNKNKYRRKQWFC